MSGGDWKEMLVAVQEGNLALVQYHIKNGVDPNYEHPELMTTPLIESVEYRQIEIAKYLLEHGADPMQCAWLSKDNPLSIAKRNGQKDFIRLLKAHRPKRFGRFWW
ncbi:MAG: ankyrin repeat domain-containing protein [Bacteroidota bacterium]